MNLEAAMAAAAEEGRVAARGKQPRSECPYEETSDDPRERVKALMWRRGWSEANPIAADTPAS